MCVLQTHVLFQPHGRTAHVGQVCLTNLMILVTGSERISTAQSNGKQANLICDQLFETLIYMKLRLKLFISFLFPAPEFEQKGFTALHLAAKYGNIQVAKLLLARQAPIDAQGKVNDDHKFLLLQHLQPAALAADITDHRLESAADRRKAYVGFDQRDSLPDFERGLQENLIEQEQLWH